MNDVPEAGPVPSRVPRAVPVGNAFAWFAEAIRLWKRGPVSFVLIALVVLVTSVVFEPVPFAGFVAANIVAPLLACGLLYASLAADRNDQPRFRHLVVVFAAPASAQATVVAAGLFVLAAEAFTAWQLAQINLLMPLDDTAGLSGSTVVAIYAIGVLASLPVTFVPMAALFDGEGPRSAFSLSFRAFARNVPALSALALYSFVLLLLGLLTMGIGLVLALPWIAAASFAAWKDIFGLAGSAPRR